MGGPVRLPWQRTGRALLIAFVVVGLLGMHALTVSSPEGESGATAHTGVANALVGDSAIPDEPVGGHAGGHGVDAGTLCLAVLAILLFLLLVLPMTGRGWRLVPRGREGPSSAPTVRRDAAPPDLHALSILRC